MMQVVLASRELPSCRALTPMTKKELMRYFPIAVTAALEGYFRILYAELIDSGEPYVSRARMFRGIRADETSIEKAKSQKVSHGELIAHQLRHNSFADINANMSILLGSDFKTLLQTDEIAVLSRFTSGADHLNYLTSQIDELFKVRHVFCHELATKLTLSRQRADRLCHSGASLAVLTDILMMDFIDSGKPFPRIMG
jgi:hypothetical protein